MKKNNFTEKTISRNKKNILSEIIPKKFKNLSKTSYRFNDSSGKSELFSPNKTNIGNNKKFLDISNKNYFKKKYFLEKCFKKKFKNTKDDFITKRFNDSSNDFELEKNSKTNLIKQKIKEKINEDKNSSVKNNIGIFNKQNSSVSYSLSKDLNEQNPEIFDEEKSNKIIQINEKFKIFKMKSIPFINKNYQEENKINEEINEEIDEGKNEEKFTFDKFNISISNSNKNEQITKQNEDFCNYNKFLSENKGYVNSLMINDPRVLLSNAENNKKKKNFKYRNLKKKKMFDFSKPNKNHLEISFNNKKKYSGIFFIKKNVDCNKFEKFIKTIEDKFKENQNYSEKNYSLFEEFETFTGKITASNTVIVIY